MISIPRSKNFEKNYQKDSGAEANCVVCGKAIKDKNINSVHTWLGSEVITHDELEELWEKEGDSADSGCFNIGVDCLRKHPELKPYLIK